MEQLHDAGLIKQMDDGSLIVVDDVIERQQLKEQISSKKKPQPEMINSNKRQAQNFGTSLQLEEMSDESNTILEHMWRAGTPPALAPNQSIPLELNADDYYIDFI